MLPASAYADSRASRGSPEVAIPMTVSRLASRWAATSARAWASAARAAVSLSWASVSCVASVAAAAWALARSAWTEASRVRALPRRALAFSSRLAILATFWLASWMSPLTLEISPWTWFCLSLRSSRSSAWASGTASPATATRMATAVTSHWG